MMLPKTFTRKPIKASCTVAHLLRVRVSLRSSRHLNFWQFNCFATLIASSERERTFSVIFEWTTLFGFGDVELLVGCSDEVDRKGWSKTCWIVKRFVGSIWSIPLTRSIRGSGRSSILKAVRTSLIPFIPNVNLAKRGSDRLGTS